MDLLSWTVATLLGLKVAATIVLLGRNRDLWFRSRWGTFLWWSTKIVPIFAVPCMIAIALLARRPGEAWIYAALMAFVLVAVPLAIRNRPARTRCGRDAAAL